MAMCVIAVVGVAPCQCFSLGANQITSPGRISSIGPPSRCAQPSPNVTINTWPNGCVCHAVRAPGSNVTLAPSARTGSFPSNSGSSRTLPVKYSAGPLPEGRDPLLLIPLSYLLSSNFHVHPLKTDRSAQNFHRVTAHTNVRDPLIVTRCSHMDVARATHLDALSNQHLFVTLCDPVLDHPTRSATGR